MRPSAPVPAPVEGVLARVGVAARRVASVWPLTSLGMAVAVVASVALLSFGFEKLDLARR